VNGKAKKAFTAALSNINGINLPYVHFKIHIEPTKNGPILKGNSLNK
jgi:hypothetical protein